MLLKGSVCAKIELSIYNDSTIARAFGLKAFHIPLEVASHRPPLRASPAE